MTPPLPPISLQNNSRKHFLNDNLQQNDSGSSHENKKQKVDNGRWRIDTDSRELMGEIGYNKSQSGKRKKKQTLKTITSMFSRLVQFTTKKVNFKGALIILELI